MFIKVNANGSAGYSCLCDCLREENYYDHDCRLVWLFCANITINCTTDHGHHERSSPLVKQQYLHEVDD